MFERFTEKSRQVVSLAQEEARVLKHNYIGTEHLLLGLLRVEEGAASQVLSALGIGLGEARSFVGSVVGFGDQATTGQIPFSPRGKRVCELALREALSLGHNYVGTEHILLGLVREDGGVAARYLKECDVTPDAVRNEVIRRLTGPRRAPADPVAEALAQIEQGVVQLRRALDQAGSAVEVAPGVWGTPPP